MTTITLPGDVTTAWCGCPLDVLDESACPNSPDMCADCCPCHGNDYDPNTSTVTFLGRTIPLAVVRDWIGDVPLTPHRVAVALRDLFGMTASDGTALSVYVALLGEPEPLTA